MGKTPLNIMESIKLNISIFVKVAFMAELLYCISSDFTGVPQSGHRVISVVDFP